MLKIIKKKLKVIYDYVTKNIKYDDKKANTVETGYIPSIDETLNLNQEYVMIIQY